MSTRNTPPATFGEFVEKTGGTLVWSAASGRTPGRISQMKTDNGGRGIESLLEMASAATGIPYRAEWSHPAMVIQPAVTEWPWTSAEDGRAA